YSLGGDLTNATNLILTPSLNFVPFDAMFSGSVAGHDLGSVDIRPVPTQTLNEGDLTIPLLNQSFALGGFQSQPGNTLTLAGFVSPLPACTQVVPAVFRPGHLSDALSQANASQPYLAGSGFVAPPGSHPGTTAQLDGQSLPSNLVSGSSSRLSFSLTQQQQDT